MANKIYHRFDLIIKKKPAWVHFLFGAATPAGKALLGGIQAQALAGLLYLGAVLGVLPMVIRERTFRWPWRAGRSTFLLLAGAIVLGGITGPLLLLLGLRAASSGSVSLWLNLEFVATVILGQFVFRHDSILHQHRHRHDGGHHDHAHDGLGAEVSHVRRHEHNPQEHVHDHWPDLHHRHGHGDEDEPPRSRE